MLCWFTPSSYATAKRKASCGSAFGSVHRIFVCSPISHFAANPGNVYQNCLSLSFPFYFREKNLNHSRVLCFGLQNASSQYVRRSCNVTVTTLVSGNMSVILFLQAVPSNRNRTLITFFSAACSLRLFIKAKFLGACSVALLNNSLTDDECFALTATVKRFLQFSQSVPGGMFTES